MRIGKGFFRGLRAPGDLERARSFWREYMGATQLSGPSVCVSGNTSSERGMMSLARLRPVVQSISVRKLIRDPTSKVPATLLPYLKSLKCRNTSPQHMPLSASTKPKPLPCTSFLTVPTSRKPTADHCQPKAIALATTAGCTGAGPRNMDLMAAPIISLELSKLAVFWAFSSSALSSLLAFAFLARRLRRLSLTSPLLLFCSSSLLKTFFSYSASSSTKRCSLRAGMPRYWRGGARGQGWERDARAC
mmetsp:Transcript_18026/g.42243  ORF Transcript_18026/g.42243 Transcript_18026/m.42243 type:complete len:247 (+) Transcript_18026:434-1174(+)